METRPSMLDRARRGDEATWRRLVDVYQPLVRTWLLGQGVISQDADDLSQEVMVVLLKKLPGFDHNGRAGAFRAWLRAVVGFEVKRFWRAGRCRTAADTVGPEVMDRLADSDSDLARAWDAEHDRHLFRRLLTVLDTDFEPGTAHAFRRLVLDQTPLAEVAAETGLTPAALYAARYRVLRRLREEAAGLVD